MGIRRHSGNWLAPIDYLEAVGCVTSRADVNGCSGGGQIVAGDSQADRRVAFGDQQPSNPNAPSGIAERTIAASFRSPATRRFRRVALTLLLTRQANHVLPQEVERDGE